MDISEADKGINSYNHLYEQIYKKICEYLDEINKIGFASTEVLHLPDSFNNSEDIIQCISSIMASNINLNKILEVCPNSIYVVDKTGNTLRANQAFEHTTGVQRENVIGKSVYDLEKMEYFRPSVNGIALREKRTVSIVQMGKNGKETIATAVPFFDKEGEIAGSVSNAKLLHEITAIIKYVGERKNKLSDLQYSDDSRMICESESMRRIIAMVGHIIDTDSSILITGETGVGKGVLTRYIHNHSKRKEHRLVEINCGAIPGTLLESELFGYESGAFTGADKRGKPGLIELADRGTIFLDEISELPLMLQVKLLHFLQNRKIIRVGGTKEILVDTRIIAASNKNLQELVLKGEFRADLFYRLNVIPIEIPPLRDRPEDLVAATEYFFSKYNKKYGKYVQIDDLQINELLLHNWPGNLRELENYAERTVVTSKENEEITQMHKMNVNQNIILSKSSSCVSYQGQLLNDALEQLERSMVIESYERLKNSYKVAGELGISQASAHRKIIKYVNTKI